MLRVWSWDCGGGAAESRVYPTMPCPCTHHPTSSGSINCACSARCSCQTMCLSYQKAVPRVFVDCPDHLTVDVLQTILRCIRISLVTHLWVAICPVGIGYRAARLNLGSAEVRPLRSRHAPEQRFAGEESSQPMVLDSRVDGERLLSSKMRQRFRRFGARPVAASTQVAEGGGTR